MYRIASTYLSLAIIILFFSKGYAQHVISLNSSSDHVEIVDFVYVKDSLNALSPTTFITTQKTAYNNTEFAPISGPSTYWVQFSVHNSTDQDQDYIFNFENWSFIDLYTGDNFQDHKRTGHRVPYFKRHYPFSNKNLIQETLQENATKEYIVRLEYSFNNEKKPVNLDFTGSARHIHDQHNFSELKWTSVFIGIYLVMLFYNFFLFLSTKDRTYLYYLFMLLILTYAIYYNSGFLVSTLGFIEPFPDILSDYIKHILSPVLAIAGIWFTQKFLNVPERYPKWNRYFNLLTYILLITIPLQFIAYEMSLGLIGLFGLIGFISCLIVGIKSTRAKYPSAIYFVIGFAFYILGLLIATWAILGIIPKNNFTFSYSMPIGSTIQMVLFSLALADKINFLKKENIHKQKLIIDHLKENEALQTKVNRELEHKVEERTAEIFQQKNQIESQKNAIELEKNKAEQLLLNILPQKTALELKANGKATPMYYENASVLFTDIIDFTRIAEKLDPNELVAHLDECFQTFDEIISNNNLEKIKTIGDSYMCAGGILDQKGNSAYNIVKAGLEMQKFLNNWNANKGNSNGISWAMRVGIHTGPLTAGVVGKKKFAFDIWGDTVNIASRMESNGIPGRVNVSESTWVLVKDYFNGSPRGKIEVKNKGKLGMWFVDSLKDDVKL